MALRDDSFPSHSVKPPWKYLTTNTPFASKGHSAAKLLSFGPRIREKRGLERAWEGHLAHSSTVRQDELHVRLSRQTFALVLTISHITSSTLPIQFTPERPSCHPTLTAMKLTTSHHISHSYKRQFIPLCYCSTLYIWRPLSCHPHSFIEWPPSGQVGHIFLQAQCPTWGTAPTSTTQAKERRRFTKHILQRTLQYGDCFFFHSSMTLLSCVWFEIHHNPHWSLPAELLSGWVSPLILCLHWWLLQINLTCMLFHIISAVCAN